MARDIEEFLKMAAKRRQQQKQGGQPAAGRPARPATTPTPAATDDEIVILGSSEAPPVRQSNWHSSVSEHVSSHIDTSSLGEHASHLGETVALADDKLDARLSSTFDHKVGNLRIDRTRSVQSSTTTTTAKTVSPLAVELLEMLGNPQSVRQAVLLSEVLKRPDFD